MSKQAHHLTLGGTDDGGAVAVFFILTSSLSGAEALGKSDKNDAAENKIFLKPKT